MRINRIQRAAVSLLLFSIFMLVAGYAIGQNGDTSRQATYGTAKERGKLKFGAYIQVLYQKAASPGISSFSGGSFKPGVDQRFTVRRARPKVTYSAGLNSAVIQLDATEDGVEVRDAYVKLVEPKWKTFGIQVGIQSWNFGYEVDNSSSRRQSPERARIIQTLYPGEQDAGIKLIIAPPDDSPLGFLNLEAGVFNGSGVASDYDSNKDFIGRLHADLLKESSPWDLGLGISLHQGGQAQNTRYRYYMEEGDSAYRVDSSEANIGKTAARRRYGIEFQGSYDAPWGATMLYAEYLMGEQPGSASSSRTARARPENDTYQREFEGAYAMLVQELGRSPLEAIIKYDFYDPNTAVAGKIINDSFTEGDISFQTWGYGLTWKYKPHIRLTAYYDRVKNEAVTLSGFQEDIDDDVLSLQLQYKF